jgi:hypothetical protein
MIDKLKPYTKSIIAGVVGLLQILQLVVQLSPGGFSTEDVTSIITAVIVALGGTAAVYQFPNVKK